MEKEIISAKSCLIHRCESPKYLLIQFCGEHELTGLESEVNTLLNEEKNICFCAVVINDWNRELSPWENPSVFGNEPFGNGGKDTLAFVLESLIPKLRAEMDLRSSLIFVGGYSLAGLFSLWSAYQTDIFDGVAAVSPSVWFGG